MTDTFLAVSRGEMANPFDGKPERKAHQLLRGHQVKSVTKEQREAIYEVAKEVGFPIEGGDGFFHTHFPHVWFSTATNTLQSIVDIDSEDDINITFDEFMARLKGEWVEPKTLTRAEACLAILNEAKEAGFEWAQSAIEQIDVERCNNVGLSDYGSGDGLLRAILIFRLWQETKEMFRHWYEIAYSDAVRNFKPKTQWPD
jgi:hypothetical protein